MPRAKWLPWGRLVLAAQQLCFSPRRPIRSHPIKESRHSVLERFAGPCRYHNQGERVMVAQRLLQSASDVFLVGLRTIKVTITISASFAT
jgi:hypothetical protein